MITLSLGTNFVTASMSPASSAISTRLVYDVDGDTLLDVDGEDIIEGRSSKFETPVEF